MNDPDNEGISLDLPEVCILHTDWTLWTYGVVDMLNYSHTSHLYPWAGGQASLVYPAGSPDGFSWLYQVRPTKCIKSKKTYQHLLFHRMGCVVVDQAYAVYWPRHWQLWIPLRFIGKFWGYQLVSVFPVIIATMGSSSTAPYLIKIQKFPPLTDYRLVCYVGRPSAASWWTDTQTARSPASNPSKGQPVKHIKSMGPQCLLVCWVVAILNTTDIQLKNTWYSIKMKVRTYS